jgi:hypothetical protein
MSIGNRSLTTSCQRRSAASWVVSAVRPRTKFSSAPSTKISLTIFPLKSSRHASEKSMCRALKKGCLIAPARLVISMPFRA